MCSSFVTHHLSYTSCKWSTIFKCNISILFTTCSCYISYFKNMWIWIITNIWFNDFYFRFKCLNHLHFWSLKTYHFLVKYFEDSLSESFNGSLSGLRQFLAAESPLEMMKNAFYFTSKALFVLKVFKFLSWLFGHVSKRLD